MSERRDFVLLAEKEEVPFAELCRRFGVSRPTGYKWLQRWEEDRVEGLEDRSRRPHTFPNRTTPEMEKLVVRLRRKHPRWGGRKLNRVLTRQGHSGVPAPSTITNILARHGLLDPDRRHKRDHERFVRDQPNDLWQTDFKGWFPLQADGSRCHPLGLLDDHSRYNLTLQACPNEQTHTVKTHFTEAFATYGLPKEILTDNGPPWGNSAPGIRWTPLCVWLCDLGIRVIHSRPLHPQTAGKEERFHLTLDWEVLSTRPSWDTIAEVQAAFDEWRPVYNHQRPHDSLHLDVPADHYQPSPRSLPTRIDPVEYPDHYQVRKVSEDARISLWAQRYKIGKPFIGRYVGIAPTNTDGILTVHYRHQRIRIIDLTTPQ